MKLLLVSPWPLRDVLTQSYVLPYIVYLRRALKRIGCDPVFHLVTFERGSSSFSPHDLSIEKSPTIQRYIPIKTGNANIYGMIASFFSILGVLPSLVFQNYSFVHSWCATGGVLAYLLSFIFNKPLVLDSFEPHADPMVECGCWSKNSFKYRFLRCFEILQARRASAFFPVSSHMYRYSLLNYHVDIKDRSFVKPACVELPGLPSRPSSLGKSSGIRGIYVGKFGGLYLGAEFFRILAVAREMWGESFSFTILSCQPLECIKQFADEACFPLDSILVKCVPHCEVFSYLCSSDFAVLALKSVPSRLCCTPVKTGEYWAAGLPVLSPPGISSDSGIIDSEGIGSILSGFDDESIRNALVNISALVRMRRNDDALSSRIRSIALRERGYEIAFKAYFFLYSRLMSV